MYQSLSGCQKIVKEEDDAEGQLLDIRAYALQCAIMHGLDVYVHVIEVHNATGLTIGLFPTSKSLEPPGSTDTDVSG